MIIRGMRWGYDGGGIACGPVEGASNIELLVQDKKGRLCYVLNNRFMEFTSIYISPFSLFDHFMLLSCKGLDYDAEYQDARSICREIYDFEDCDYPEAMLNSDFLDAIKFTYTALDAFDPDNTAPEASARSFILKYLGTDTADLDGLALPQEDSCCIC